MPFLQKENISASMKRLNCFILFYRTMYHRIHNANGMSPVVFVVLFSKIIQTVLPHAVVTVSCECLAVGAFEPKYLSKKVIYHSDVWQCWWMLICVRACAAVKILDLYWAAIPCDSRDVTNHPVLGCWLKKLNQNILMHQYACEQQLKMNPFLFHLSQINLFFINKHTVAQTQITCLITQIKQRLVLVKVSREW